MSVDFSAIIENFLTAELGEEVRGSLVEIAEALQTAINSQLNTVTGDFANTDHNAAILVSAIANILFGGSDQAGKTPSVNVHFNPTLDGSASFNVADMPRNSHIYKDGAVLENIPDALKADSAVYVARIPKTVSGNVSMFFATGGNTGRSFFANRFIENTQTIISWVEISALLRGRNYAGATNIDDLVDQGIYFSDLDSSGNKTLPGFPFGVGFLAVLPLTSIAPRVVTQIAISNQLNKKAEILIRSGRLEGSSMVWTSWASTDEDDDIEDFIYTDFETDPDIKWWTLTGGHYDSGVATKPIRVRPGQILYGMWFGGNPPQSCGGAFLGLDNRWVGPIAFPFGSAENPNAEEYTYAIPDVKPEGTTLAYSKLWKVEVPADAAYVSLNLRTVETAPVRHCQSVSTLPIIGVTNDKNRIWRKGDPARAQKKDKILYIIGPSTVAIDRSNRRIYTAPSYTDPTEQYPYVDPASLPQEPIVGFQEYLIPYYKKVVSLGFDGQGYLSDGSTAGVAEKIISGNYTYAEDFQLNDADEVLILPNGNETGTNNTIGTAEDDTFQTYCGALNKLIDFIYENNSGHAVRIYLHTRVVQYPEGSTRATQEKTRNERHREIAKLRSLGLIEETGLNFWNYRFCSYDANRDIYNPYGGHPNNEGNRIRGLNILNGLMNGG